MSALQKLILPGSGALGGENARTVRAHNAGQPRFARLAVPEDAAADARAEHTPQQNTTVPDPAACATPLCPSDTAVPTILIPKTTTEMSVIPKSADVIVTTVLRHALALPSRSSAAKTSWTSWTTDPGSAPHGPAPSRGSVAAVADRATRGPHRAPGEPA